MDSRRLTPSRTTDFSVIIILYTIIFFASLVFLISAIDGIIRFPSAQSGVLASLLGILVFSLLITLIVALRRFLKEYKNKTWGYRTRGRILLYFLLVVAMASIPSSLYLGTLAVRAVNSPLTKSVQTALDSGMELALFYYSSKENSLKYIAENDVPELLNLHGMEAKKILDKLKAKEADLCALELLADSKAVSFSGEPMTKSALDQSSLDKSMFLPRLFSGGVSYSRYYARYPEADTAGQNLSAILTIRFNEDMEKAAEDVLSGISIVGKNSQFAGSFSVYLIVFSLFLVAPLVMIAMLFSISAADKLVQPMSLFSGSLYKIRTGLNRVPYLAKPGDEAGDLIESLNSLLEYLERSRGDEIHNEKINAWKDIARKLAHELRNPLTPIKLSAERVLKRWKSDPASINDLIEKSMVAIIQETAAMEALLTEFKDFARLPEPNKAWMDLKSTVEEVVLLYSQPWPQIKIDYYIDENIKLKADRAYLKQVLGNLISNAAEACKGKGNIIIRADLVKTAESRYCRILVRDDGPGIPEDLQNLVFSPYFTTKQGGTGLGLSIVENIVSSHGGSIKLESREGSGSVFYLDIPAEG